MNRRAFLASIPATLALARSSGADEAPAPASSPAVRFGLCTFSCAVHWKAVAEKRPGTKFSDACGFYEYARTLGADGIQTTLRPSNAATAQRLRQRVEATGGYYEAECRLPKVPSDLEAFETEVRLAREAGAAVARVVLHGGRRYEVFHSLAEFREFQSAAERSLALAEPVVRRHQLRLAVENHKDLTAPELVALLTRVASEWVGALVDTGNSIALLEDPYRVVEALAPFAASVHLKDMAVQPYEDGFLLSEVPLGEGCLDLRRMVATLTRAKPGLALNLEMATRDPLKVPCLTPAFGSTFPESQEPERVRTLAFVKAHPPGGPVPRAAGLDLDALLAAEERNNRACLRWMGSHLRI